MHTQAVIKFTTAESIPLVRPRGLRLKWNDFPAINNAKYICNGMENFLK